MLDRRLFPALPEPLRASETGTFTHHSVVERLPDIGRRVLAENEFPETVNNGILDLLDEIPEAPLRRLTDNLAPDVTSWSDYLKPYKGQNWLQVPWFLAETYFYRRVLEATGYFLDGPGRGIDPFAYQKGRGLEVSRDAIHDLTTQIESLIAGDARDQQSLANLLHIDLWGNQADLSLWPAGSQVDPTHGDDHQKRDHLLVDDSALVAAHLIEPDIPATRVDFLIDNAGFELVVDLCLAIYLLQAQLTETVVLNLKTHPTFVSDATEVDVHKTTAFLSTVGHTAMNSVASRLSQLLASGRIQLRSHFFWTSPMPMWEMPDALQKDLVQSTLIISKGDANYRRLLGDRHWPYTTPFADIVAYLPAPLAALRAIKSEVASGIKADQSISIASQDPTWMTSGRWGVIQFANPAKAMTGHPPGDPPDRGGGT